MTDDEARTTGQRLRTIRKRRGLSLDVVAGLVGRSKQYLSMLERGERGFNRRGLLEDLAEVLSCSVADLTGQPYHLLDRDAQETFATVPGIQLVLNDYGPDDVPDVSPRPLEQLVLLADNANEHCTQARYSLAGKDIGTLLTELQVHALTTRGEERDRAVTSAVVACFVAGVVAGNVANVDLSAAAAQRGYDVALGYGSPGLVGFTRWYWSLTLTRLAARRRATSVLTTGIDELTPAVHLTGPDSLPAEMAGLMHLARAHTAAREGRADDARADLAEAEYLAVRIGEHNGMLQHFGPTNVALWRLGIGIELSDSGRAYEETMRAELDLSALGSAEREASLRLNLARALVYSRKDRDAEAIRHLDVADRLAPQRIRMDPMARELVLTLVRRAPRRVWELDSLHHRFGLGEVNNK
ncbi:MAG TPA: helix-turn-helix transcriptional regulator [Pseudonocardiaceae bacterium]|nr:helix-turn-helix transcriptional regulator [Pseudonocardiaceae bacterium]